MAASEGSCDARFARVREEFDRNFAERDELGASVCVTVDGEPVVDLWGGVADESTGRHWTEDTVVLVFSSSKGVTATCAHLLIDRGQLDLDTPVARYWPDFAQAGKQDIPVRWLLSHQAGLPAWRERLPLHGLYDWELTTRLLAAQAPYWEPGTRVGYHAITFGHLVGELVRQISGKSLGTFLRDEITGPLGLDLWIGLPERHETHVAPVQLFDLTTTPESPFAKALAEPVEYRAQAFMNDGGWMSEPGELNSRAAHAAEIPAGNAVTNARGLAGLYAPLALDGSAHGVRLVAPGTLVEMRIPQAITARDAVLASHTSFTTGYSKSWVNPELGEGMSAIYGEHAFGTLGGGGNLGLADPDARMSFGYTCNRHGPNSAMNQRGQSLLDATYQSLGFRSKSSGFWVR
jgi:CubicO group peptidase (beta-lactamase class C family)